MPYAYSTALAKLKTAQAAGAQLKLAFLDVDGTLTGRPADQEALRATLEKQGYVIIFVTHRSRELCLSDEKTSDDQFRGLLDPDIIAGKLGNEIVVRQVDGSYKNDENYTKPVPLSPEEWPLHKQAAVDHVFTALCSHLSTPPGVFSVLLAGDTLPDLSMGLLGAADSKAIFLVPGGAPLPELLFSATLAEQYPLQQLKKGIYRFSPTNRTVIIGDEAFPGTLGPTTLLAWLKNQPVL